MTSQPRRRAPLTTLLVLLGTSVGACAPHPEPVPGPGPEASQALVARGAEVYGYSCGRCHNPRAAIERTDRSWETIVDHMRVRANLTGAEARAVTAFMRALNLAPETRVVYDTVVVIDTVLLVSAEAAARVDTARAEPRRAAPTADELVRIGEELIAAKGCAGCHMVSGKGGTVGPALDAVFANRDSTYIRRKLRDPRFDNPSSVMPEFGLTDVEIQAILAYLRHLRT